MRSEQNVYLFIRFGLFGPSRTTDLIIIAHKQEFGGNLAQSQIEPG